MSNFYLSIGKLLRVLDCSVPSPGADPDICAGYIEDATLKSEALVAEVKTLRIRNKKLAAEVKTLRARNKKLEACQYDEDHDYAGIDIEVGSDVEWWK